jgi:ribosomal protein S18 acetylase RimI-like enzyme
MFSNYLIKSFDRQDENLFPAIIDLINYNKFNGQPSCNKLMLDGALAKKSLIDSSYWREINDFYNLCCVAKEDNKLLGIIGYGIRSDNSGVISWLYCQGNKQVEQALINYALSDLNKCKEIEAFTHASGLDLGLEGLPGNRTSTNQLLLESGFDRQDLWLYMTYDLNNRGQLIEKDQQVEIQELNPNKINKDYRQARHFNLFIKQDNETVANAEFIIYQSIGLLSWIEVNSHFRNQGYARRLIKQIKLLAVSSQVKQIILYVDHDQPENKDRDRRPAIKLYLSEGWEEIDHLYSYFKSNR